MATNSNNFQKVTIVIGPCRLSYPFLFRPYKSKEHPEDPPMYRTDLIIPANEVHTIKSIKGAIAEAAPAGVIKGDNLVGASGSPLKDGNAKDQEVYKNTLFLSPKSKTQPGLSKKAQGVYYNATEDDIYSGCWVYAEVTFQAYNRSGNKGVSCYLNNILKFKDDTPLEGTRHSAKDAFKDVPDFDEEPSINTQDDDDLPFGF